MSDNPPRTTFASRLKAPFRWTGRRIYYLPRAAQIVLAVAIVGGLVGGGVYATTHLKKREKAKALTAAWRDFDDAARKTDTAAMGTALDRVLAAQPADPTATKRKTALETGAAADDDAEMAVLLVNYHSGGGRLAEAAREAEKVLRKYKKHWRAHCVVAHHAVAVLKDRDKAAAALGALPNPEDPESMIDPGGLLYAIYLSDVIGRDAAPLRGLIVRRLLPVLRGPTAANAPPGAKAQLVNCYLQPFADSGSLTELATFWAAAAKLADSAVTEAVEKGDADVLIQLGLLGGRSLRALALVRDHEKMPPERFEALSKEIDDRTRRAWTAAKEKAPARWEPYHGLAILAVRGKDLRGAIEFLRQGLVACGERPELLALLTPLLGDVGGADVAMELTWQAAQKAGTDPAKWCLAAGAAAAAGRRDRAILACQNARRPPNEKHPHACQIEARLWLEAGEPGKAVELLRSLDADARRVNPLLALLYARTLTESGLTVLLDDEFAAVVAAHDAGGTLRPPVPVVAFLRGVYEAKNAAGSVPWVAKRANEVAAKWPDDAPARRLVADTLYRTAELTDPPWNLDASRAAVRAFDSLPVAAREDFDAVARVAALQLRGLNDKGAAYSTAAPLREPDAAPLLSPAQMEVLGGVYLAAGKRAEAIAVLERAVEMRSPPAGCNIQLALAYHANRQPEAARRALERALTITRSPREQAEWSAANILLQRENP